MLSSVPTREERKPKNYTTPILVGFILVLIIALSGIASLYYYATQSYPTVIVINQTPNDTSNQTQLVKDVSTKPNTQKKTKNTNSTKKINKKTTDKSKKQKNPTNST